MSNMQQYGRCDSDHPWERDRETRAARVPEQNQRNQTPGGARHETREGRQALFLSHVGAIVAVGAFPHAGCKSHCAIMICDQDADYGVAWQGCRGRTDCNSDIKGARLSKYAFLSVCSIVSISQAGQEVRSNVEQGVELGFSAKRLPFLVNHCTCRSSAAITTVLYLPASNCDGSDFPAAKTICQSGTPTHTHTCPAGRDDRPLRSLTLKGGAGWSMRPSRWATHSASLHGLSDRLPRPHIQPTTTYHDQSSPPPIPESRHRPDRLKTNMTLLLFKHCQAHMFLFACHRATLRA